jgi:hypothetical protein
MLPLDHILWAVPDRDEGIAYFERLTGIRAVIGGSHPGRGTRNALVSLGANRYLELIAPDPAQPPAENFGAAIRSLTAPKLLTFVVACTDLETLGRKAGKANIPFKGPELRQSFADLHRLAELTPPRPHCARRNVAS